MGNHTDRDVILKMIKALGRRGPDDFGIWCDNEASITLGQTRLSIIDLSQTGHQPMISYNGRWTIVFNGEIYNYKDLKRELSILGAKFISQSDTEVILWAWQIWGKQAPIHFRGMFAFAIWDSLEKTLTLVRDRMGIKPLVWANVNGSFIFASTITALLESGIVSPILNEEAFFDLLSLGAALQPRAIIKGVKMIDPGCMMIIGTNGNITTETFWELKRNETLAQELSQINYDVQVNKTRQLLEDATQYHLVSDVSVGSFLSGGVDSTTITALMAKLSPNPIKSFSIGFENGRELQNELRYAKIAADFIGCDHTEFILTGKDVAEAFDDFISVIDQPSADGINTYWVSRVAKNYVKVALSGLGGDEIFAGYDHFGWFTNQAPKSRTIVDRFTRSLYFHYPWLKILSDGFVRTAEPIELLSILRRQLTDGEILSSVQSHLAEKFKEGRIQDYIRLKLEMSNPDKIYLATLYECQGYLLNTLLRDADTLSMGNSLEVRPVLLDHKLVEFALALPSTSKWRNGKPKAVLKDAASELLPSDFFNRRKTGFTLPTQRWLNNELKERFKDTLNSKRATDFFTLKFLQQTTTKMDDARYNSSAWMIFVFLEWINANEIKLD